MQDELKQSQEASVAKKPAIVARRIGSETARKKVMGTVVLMVGLLAFSSMVRLSTKHHSLTLNV